MYKIITVCGLGVGSSLILKMTIESALKQLNMKADVEHWDMGTVKGRQCDLIVTTNGFKKNFDGQENVVFVDSFVDVNETKEKLEVYLKSKNIL